MHKPTVNDNVDFGVEATFIINENNQHEFGILKMSLTKHGDNLKCISKSKIV